MLSVAQFTLSRRRSLGKNILIKIFTAKVL